MKTVKLLESKSFQDILNRLISYSKNRPAETKINKGNNEEPGVVALENFIEAIRGESYKDYGETVDFMKTLTDDEILYVEAVMLCGRGDFDNVEDAAEYIRTNFGFDRNLAIEYILSKKTLHEYLEQGIKQ